MIKINSFTIFHPRPKTYELKILFATPESKHEYTNHLGLHSVMNRYSNVEKDFLRACCCLNDNIADSLHLLPDGLLLEEYWGSSHTNEVAIRFEKEDDNMPIDNARVTTPTLYAYTFIHNIWVNKKKDIVVVELSKGNKTKKIKVHKEKGVKFDVYAAVCAAMAEFEYGSNSAFKREIERKVHYVESK